MRVLPYALSSSQPTSLVCSLSTGGHLIGLERLEATQTIRELRAKRRELEEKVQTQLDSIEVLRRRVERHRKQAAEWKSLSCRETRQLEETVRKLGRERNACVPSL